jgi:hypothetical protein
MASSNNNFKRNSKGSPLKGGTPHWSILPSRFVLKLE